MTFLRIQTAEFSGCLFRAQQLEQPCSGDISTMDLIYQVQVSLFFIRKTECLIRAMYSKQVKDPPPLQAENEQFDHVTKNIQFRTRKTGDINILGCILRSRS